MLNMMRTQLGQAGRKELEEMLKRGCSMRLLIFFPQTLGTAGPPLKKRPSLPRGFQALDGDKCLWTVKEMIKLIRSELDTSAAAQLDEMLRCGCSHDEVDPTFMNRSEI